MSWNFSKVGKPSEVIDAIGAHHVSLTGDAKIAFGHVVEPLAMLVGQNGQSGAPGFPDRIRVVASGHGTYHHGDAGPEVTGGSCAVSIEPMYDPIPPGSDQLTMAAPEKS